MSSTELFTSKRLEIGNSQSESPGESPLCFHCGEDVPHGETRSVLINGERRSMCCAGCEAVAQAIVDFGLEKFYRFRKEKASRPEELVPEELRQLKVYDDDAMQQHLVETAGDEMKSCSLLLSELTCPACAWLIESRLEGIAGVREINVNYSTQRARLCWDERSVKLSEVLRSIVSLGYKARLYDPTRAAAQIKQEQDQQLRRLGVAGVLGMQVMMLSIAMYVGDSSGMKETYRSFFSWLCLLLCTPVIFYSAQSFFIRAWRDLNIYRVGMDVPVSLGLSIAYLASVVATITKSGTIYYDSAVMFTFFLLAARYVEFSGRRKAALHIDRMANGTPSIANRVTGSTSTNELETVPARVLEAGDLVLVRPGELVPADGYLEKGETSVDESLVTGESHAITKTAGESLIGGSVNIAQATFMRVSRTGKDTITAHILRLIERGQEIKPEIQAFANRVSVWFICTVLILSMATAWYWSLVPAANWIGITISVLVVSCPCALSLATPLAIASASAALMKRGIVLANANVLEALGEVNHFIFDKTGTLISGDLFIDKVQALANNKEEECLQIAGAMQLFSAHPIAKAFHSKYVADASLGIDEVTDYPSLGLSSMVNGARYFLGNEQLLRRYCDIDVATSQPQQGTGHENRLIYLANENELLCKFEIADSIYGDSKKLVDYLRARGKTVSILSGDSEAPTRKFAAAIGIDSVLWEQTPDQKMNYLADLQEQGQVVAMVGDGINDAPVLSSAGVSIAMGKGAALASSKADLILLNNRVGSIRELTILASLTRKVIRENMLWALSYNLVALPMAIAGLVQPWMAAIGMSLSSLLVLLNSSRIEKKRV